MRLPVLLQAPADPIPVRPIRIDSRTTPRRLTLQVMTAAPRQVVPATLLLIMHQVGESLVPVIMGFAIDQAVATGDPVRLALCVALLGADFALLSYSYRFGSRFGLLGIEAVQHRLRTLVADRLLDSKGVKGRAGLPGVSLSIASSDVTNLAKAVSIVPWPAGELAAVLLCGTILMVLSWQLGLIVLLGVPLLLFIMDRAGGPLRRRSHDQSTLAGEASGKAADLLAGYRVISGLGAQSAAADRYRKASRDALDGSLHAAGAQGVYTGSMNLASGLFVAGLALVAGLRALNGDLTIGQLITIVGLTQFIMGPLGTLATNAGAIWAGALASAERVLSILQLPHHEARHGDAVPEAGDGQLSLANVRTAGLDGVDLDVAPGECVGVRTTPAASAELAALLSGSAEPDSGTVTWQGRPFSDFDLDALRRSVLVVPHHAALFDGSILDNVGLLTADRAAIDAALDAADCAEIVEAAPDGLDTQVGEDGLRLSGGQRQRIALARALAQEPPLLVLQDPTTAVDSVTESRIAERLRAARGKRSTLLVTDAPALLAVCDRVIDLNQVKPNE
ncbi:ABC-type multidrug transport system, ATPase and permease component [Glycomyces sambucus]|uniref:ABC-type multidrug transport system, ATPase and permease component n=1 Tax=Glycomyces sambucus TaxID=380244 RepID=A0A1G9D7V7_9ACTN|nr:ABC transporter ATP-binding protein [Glycomyces sambucus]SDK59805.1 ABC-type multidrug transport system, ATPase and permease component [Glycomyces sambucus]